MLLTAAGGCQQIQKQTPSASPNIIYILADDMGYGDVKALNQASKIPTPNLDRMVNEGLSFTDAHSNSAVCTPTRYGILTGRYCFRSRMKSGVLVGHEPSLIEPGRPTVGTLLQKAGYQTACIGKWHLGLDWAKKDPSQPLWHGGNLWDMENTENVDYAATVNGGPADHGFDYSFIIPASLDIAPYVYVENKQVTAPVSRKVPFFKDEKARGVWYRKGDIADDFDHTTVLQTLTEKAVHFISEASKKEQPFFLYFPMSAPHTPWFSAKEFQGKSQAGVYGDFVVMVDAMVGKILATMDKKTADNTMIIFTSDNGSNWLPQDIEQFNHRANGPYIGMKSDVWEGGHRVPFIVRWPKSIKGASRSNEVICTTDLMATCAALTNQRLANDAGEDSYNLLPVLQGKKLNQPLREATVHHSVNGTFAIRKGEWKYIAAKGSGGWSLPENKVAPDAPEGQLYNMTDDPTEQHNLYNQMPEKVAELKALLKKYRSQGYSRPMPELREEK
ncbi:sulfatase [Marinilabiliaceae bacterium JC017]|nr:sulfatase [Marinilabiliaceae bacterium JC017]